MLLPLVVLSIFWVMGSLLYVGFNLNLDSEPKTLFLFYASIKQWCDDNKINNFGRFILYSLSTLILLPGIILIGIILLIIYLGLLCITEIKELFIYVFKRK